MSLRDDLRNANKNLTKALDKNSKGDFIGINNQINEVNNFYKKLDNVLAGGSIRDMVVINAKGLHHQIASQLEHSTKMVAQALNANYQVDAKVVKTPKATFQNITATLTNK